MVRGRQGPVKHLAQKIVAVNYCGRQLAIMMGWAAPAYHKKEGATLIREHASLTCSMTGGLMSALGYRLGCEI